MGVPRKILIRVIGAPLLVAALCAILYWGHGFEQKESRNYPLFGLILVVGYVCAFEFLQMCKARGVLIPRDIHGVVCNFFGMTVAGWYLYADRLHPAAPFAAVAMMFFLYVAASTVFRYGRFTPEAAGLTVFGYLYVCLLGFLLFPPVPRDVATYYLLFLLAAGKGSDMAAFVVGKSIGRHKMSPVVSPNKTWEGGIAGGLVGAAAGFCVLWFTPLKQSYGHIPVAALLLFCLVVTIAAQVGDLFKSVLKRWAGVKDSGRILPEFGGMIDMVDSFLIAGPVGYLGTRLLFEGN